MNQEYAVESTPRHLWIVGILAVLWNAMGGLDFVMTHTRNEAWLAGFTPEQLEYFLGFPLWANVTWGIAVWGSIIASILLLARSRFALTGFLVSLIAMTLTTVYNYLLTDGLAIMGQRERRSARSYTFVACCFMSMRGE